MAKDGWITLADYSSKYRVSVSTLRRRIKAETAQYLLESGKYWLRDLPLKSHRPKEVNNPDPTKDAAPPHTLSSKGPAGSDHKKSTSNDESLEVLAISVNKMMDELKATYSLLLKEKDHQILTLKSEITDLKTLVSVLENQVTEQNSKKVSKKKMSQNESWLDLEN